LILFIIISSAALYACRDCGEHFTKLLEKYPIKNNSRDEVMEYMCFLHNKVNERLKKPSFECSKVAQYWGGDCGCSAKKNEGE
jgi:hypothetical protein